MIACTTSNYVVSDKVFKMRKYTKGFCQNKKASVKIKTYPKLEDNLLSLNDHSENYNIPNPIIHVDDTKGEVPLCSFIHVSSTKFFCD